MGMVGGGRGAFIGQVHRMAANLDGKIELVAGAFSSDPEKSKLSGEDFFLDPDRVYGSYQEMAEKEARREDKVDFVSIVVQNFLHFDVAKTFIEAECYDDDSRPQGPAVFLVTEQFKISATGALAR